LTNKLTAQIIDIQSGKPTHDINEGDIVRIIKEKQFKIKKADEPKILINKEESFIKVFTKPLFELSKCLSGTESQFINYLIQFVRYDTGILAYDNGKHVTREAMAKDTGLSKKTIDRLIISLSDKEVLGKHKTGRCTTLTVNPFIFMRGHKVNQTLYEFFVNSKWAKMFEKPEDK
jgi:hypothetical protein